MWPEQPPDRRQAEKPAAREQRAVEFGKARAVSPTVALLFTSERLIPIMNTINIMSIATTTTTTTATTTTIHYYYYYYYYYD